MKKLYFSFILMLLFSGAYAQNSQTVFVNGGAYGNPDDKPEVFIFEPQTGVSESIGIIHTNSVQAVAVQENMAFVAAEDSLVHYNLLTGEREAAIQFDETPGNGLCADLEVYGNYLIVSKQDGGAPPTSGIYTEVYSIPDLALVYEIEEATAQSGGIVVISDTTYIAVNGGFAATETKIACFDLQNFTYTGEIDFELSGYPMKRIFTDGLKIYGLLESPWGGQGGGFVVYHLLTGAQEQVLFTEGNYGRGLGLKNGQLYFIFNNQIAAFNTDNYTVQTLFPLSLTPGYSVSSATFDITNNAFHLLATDYFSGGEGFVFDLSGNLTATYTDAGVSPEGLAMYYAPEDFPVTVNSGFSLLIEEGAEAVQLDLRTIFPNPANAEMTYTVSHNSMPEIIETQINDNILTLTPVGGLVSGNVDLEITATANSQTATSNFSVEVPAVMNVNPLSENKIQFYPNPVKNQLTITSEKERIYSVEIVSITGQLMQKIRVENHSITIDSSQWPAQLYVARIYTTTGISIQKIIKK